MRDIAGGATEAQTHLLADAAGSRATNDLVVDALPEGASLNDLGEDRLRDLARRERVF